MSEPQEALAAAPPPQIPPDIMAGVAHVPSLQRLMMGVPVGDIEASAQRALDALRGSSNILAALALLQALETVLDVTPAPLGAHMRLASIHSLSLDMVPVPTGAPPAEVPA